jgi:hypothetical protein
MCNLAEMACGPTVLLLKGPRRVHGMNQIIGHSDAGHRSLQRVALQDVAANDLGRSRHPGAEKLWAPRQTAHSMPRLFQGFE